MCSSTLAVSMRGFKLWRNDHDPKSQIDKIGSRPFGRCRITASVICSEPSRSGTLPAQNHLPMSNVRFIENRTDAAESR